MASTDLLFGQALNPPSGPVEIVFGDDEGGLPPGGVELQAAGRITGLRGYVAVRTLVRAKAAGRITGLRGHVDAVYDINVERPLAGTARTSLQQAQRTAAAVLQRYERARPVLAGVGVRWQDARSIGVDLQARWQQSARVACVAAVVEQQAVRLGLAPARQGLQQADRRRTDVRQGMQQAVRLATATRQGMQQGVRLRAVAVQRFEGAGSLGAPVRSAFRDARQLGGVWGTRFEQARPPGAGITVPVVPPQPEPCYVPTLPAHLLFELASETSLPAQLVFVCERHGQDPEPELPQYIIPLLRVYMTVHSIDAVLLPSLDRVPLNSLSITADDDGFGWNMSASGPVRLMEQLAPSGGVPQRVRVSIDGIDWVFACEMPERSRKFGEQGAQVRGSSLTALLGAPHMPSSIWTAAGAMTAQQLVAQALEFTGVGIDWGLDDWLVPNGVWSHQGTPLSVAQRIAEAAGAVLRSHRTEPTLQFAPRYPHMPWAWPTATPTVRMPGAIITTDTLQPVANTAYNAVYVSGETTGGVLGHVVRALSAGDVLAQQVTDALITHELAARQRGSAVLARAAITKRQPITVPLLTGGTNPGLILPGYLIEVVEPDETWRGLVRGITVTAGMPTVRQQLDVERADGVAGGGSSRGSVNLFRRLQDLQPAAPVQTGQITAVRADGNASVLLVGGGTLLARNPLKLPTAAHVFVQGGAITGEAPNLPYVRIEI